MATGAKKNQGANLPSAALLPFVLISFGITWGLVGFYIILPDLAAGWFGQISGQHPIFFLATWAPAIAAFTLVGYHGGWEGIRRFVARAGLWRCSGGWLAFLVIGVPLVFIAGSWIKGNLFSEGFRFESVGGVLAVMVLMAFLGPVEEFGWRGLAQPLLQRHMAPFWAGLAIGVTWGIWHLPAFYLSGTVQSGWSFTPFFIGNVTLAIIVTPLFNASRGSILLPALFHYQLINPLWPDAQPYDILLLLVVAAVMLWVHRRSFFRRDSGVTSVFISRAPD